MDGRIGQRVSAEDDKEASGGMPSFVPSLPLSNELDTEENHNHAYRVSDLGALEQSIGLRVEDSLDCSTSVTLSTNRVPAEGQPSEGLHYNLISQSSAHLENWGESRMADASPRTDTSTDVDTDDKNQRFDSGPLTGLAASDSSDRTKEKTGDQKTCSKS